MKTNMANEGGYHVPKAFDKMDHSILMKNVIKHDIKGKIGSWILDFLINRKFWVIVNGIEFEKKM